MRAARLKECGGIHRPTAPAHHTISKAQKTPHYSLVQRARGATRCMQ